ncbi:choline dehydrogenase 7 [Conglomerata obtusa]
MAEDSEERKNNLETHKSGDCDEQGDVYNIEKDKNKYDGNENCDKKDENDNYTCYTGDKDGLYQEQFENIVNIKNCTTDDESNKNVNINTPACFEYKCKDSANNETYNGGSKDSDFLNRQRNVENCNINMGNPGDNGDNAAEFEMHRVEQNALNNRYYSSNKNEFNNYVDGQRSFAPSINKDPYNQNIIYNKTTRPNDENTTNFFTPLQSQNNFNQQSQSPYKTKEYSLQNIKTQDNILQQNHGQNINMQNMQQRQFNMQGNCNVSNQEFNMAGIQGRNYDIESLQKNNMYVKMSKEPNIQRINESFNKDLNSFQNYQNDKINDKNNLQQFNLHGKTMQENFDRDLQQNGNHNIINANTPFVQQQYNKFMQQQRMNNLKYNTHANNYQQVTKNMQPPGYHPYWHSRHPVHQNHHNTNYMQTGYPPRTYHQNANHNTQNQMTMQNGEFVPINMEMGMYNNQNTAYSNNYPYNNQFNNANKTFQQQQRTQNYDTNNQENYSVHNDQRLFANKNQQSQTNQNNNQQAITNPEKNNRQFYDLQALNPEYNTNKTEDKSILPNLNTEVINKSKDAFSLADLKHPDPYAEYQEEKTIFHKTGKVQRKRRKIVEDDDDAEDGGESPTTSDDEDTSYVSSSSIHEEEAPKKRGRPRKIVQPSPFQMHQMPYNPAIQSPLGNQYQPSYRPMMFKPVNPFNPHLPRYSGDYRTKHMRNASGSNASSYNSVFNNQMPKPMFYPPNMFVPPQMMYQPPNMYQGMPQVQRPAYNQMESTIPYNNYAYARPPSVGRPKSMHKKDDSPIPPIRKKRKSAAKTIIKKIELDEDVISEEETDEEEQDPIEKLLNKRNDDFYLVKFRHKSYLHCDWVHKDEISQTKGGLIKVKRFRAKEESFDPEFTKIDKIFLEDYEDVETDNICENAYMGNDGRYYTKKKIYLIKWKKMAHELSTFEYEEKVKELEGFNEELKKYYTRKTTKPRQHSIEWRPNRENFIRFNTSPIFKNNNTLRAYQLEGLNWLLNRWFYKQGCIMADEMGLGKTVQSVTFINTLFTRYECGPVLIVAPLSTIPHWEREFEAWSDLRITTYHGSIQGREIIYSYEMINKDDKNSYLFDVLITTYEMVISGIKHLEGIRFSVGIFDEAHRLKNNNSKAVLASKSIYFNHKVLLSGTPLQNNLQELWALLNFIDPLRYNSSQFFLEEYKLEKSEDVERLQNLLKPLMLRRMKDDVEKSIPVKEETIIEVELTMIQKKFYRAILEKNLEFLARGERAPNLGNIMVELRKCCIHPYLIAGAEEKIIKDYKDKQRRLDENREIDKFEIEEENKLNTLGRKSIDVINDANDTVQKDNYNPDLSTDENANNNNPHESDTKVNLSGAYLDCNIDSSVSNNSTVDSNNIETTVDNENLDEKEGNFDDENIDEKEDEEIIVKDLSHHFNFFGLTYDDYYKVLIQSSGKLVLLDKLLNKLKGKHKVLIFSQMTTCLNLLAEYLTYRKYKYERIDGGVRADHRQAAIDRFAIEENNIFVFLLCTRAGGVGINLTAADTVVIFDSDWNPQNDLQAQARCHRIGQKNEVKIYRLVTRNSYEREMFDKAGLKLGLDRAVLQKMSFEGDKKMKKNAAIELLLKKGAYGVLMETDDVNMNFCEEDIDSILERRTKVVKHLESGNIFSKASFQVDEEVDDPHFWENLLSKKKSEADEGKIKRQVRRLARTTKIDVNEIDRIIQRLEGELENFNEETKLYKKIDEIEVKSDSGKSEVKRNKNIKKNNKLNKNDFKDESNLESNTNDKLNYENQNDNSNKDIKSDNISNTINDENIIEGVENVNIKLDINSGEFKSDINNAKITENVNVKLGIESCDNKISDTKKEETKIVENVEPEILKSDIKTETVSEKTSSTNDFSSDLNSFIYTQKLTLLVFLTTLKKGINALQTLKYAKHANKILSSVVKFCIEKIDSKQKDDFSLQLEHLMKEMYDKEIFEENIDLYEKYHEVFILRIQIVLILNYLMKKSDLASVERGKGFSYEDDKRIVNWVMTYGYDNFPSSTGREKGAFKGKSSNDLNQRLRKIIFGLNKKNEDDGDDEKIKEDVERECLYLFGRICNDNRENVKLWFNKRINDDREYEDFEGEVDKIVQTITGAKKKRGVSEIGLHKRILLFDRLRDLEQVPVLKKSHGLSRKWGHEKDVELRETVLFEGLKDEIMGVNMDAAVKRLTMLVEKNEDE